MAKDLKDELLDTGKRASERVTCLVSDGNIYDVDDDDSGDKHTVPCGVCNNTGDCQNCGGEGYVLSSDSDKEDLNCHACSRGKCSSCKGDGWLN